MWALMRFEVLIAILLCTMCIKRPEDSDINQSKNSVIISSLDGDLTVACAGTDKQVIGLSDLYKKPKQCGLNVHLRDTVDVRNIVIGEDGGIKVTCQNGATNTISDSQYNNHEYCLDSRASAAIAVAAKYSDLQNYFLKDYATHHNQKMNLTECQTLGRSASTLSGRYEVYASCKKHPLIDFAETYSRYINLKEQNKDKPKDEQSGALVSFAIENMKQLETEIVYQISKSIEKQDDIDRVVKSYTVLRISALPLEDTLKFGALASKIVADSIYKLFSEYHYKKMSAEDVKKLVNACYSSDAKKAIQLSQSP